MMSISGTTRTVVKSRMLPRWSWSQLGLIARLPCRSSAAEFERLDVLPGNVDAPARYRAPQEHAAQVHVVGVHPGSVGQEHGSGRPDMLRRDVRGQRTVLDRLVREGETRDAGDGDLGGHAAPVDRDLLGLPVALDGVWGLASEEAVEGEERWVDVLGAKPGESERRHAAELPDGGSGSATTPRALLGLRYDGVEDLERGLGDLPRLSAPGTHCGRDVLGGRATRRAGEGGGEEQREGCLSRHSTCLRGQWLIALSSFIRPSNEGARVTRKNAGIRKNTVGNSIFRGARWACSSARCRRWTRAASAWTRSVFPNGVPSFSVWMNAPTIDRSSSTPDRSARTRKASCRGRPARTSRCMRSSSLWSGLFCFVGCSATRATAASKPRPASTQTIRRSSTSGRAWMISRRRTLMRL